MVKMPKGLKEIDLSHVRAARERILPHVHRTPVLTSRLLNEMTGATLSFKCENQQATGAFKIRGALNAVLSLSDEEASRGVATHSSGNHGAALARAAQIRGIPAYIVMPENAPVVKRDAVAAYGGEITWCKPTLADRETALAQLIEARGACFVPPYDHPRVICGQGTVALELVEQVPELDLVIAPVGGGGLLAGIAVALSEGPNGIRVLGAEPSQADDAWRSLQLGERVTDQVPDTIADGLRTVLGELNFPLIQAMASEILRVSEAGIVLAMELIWTRLKQVVEPSAAVPLAAVLEYPEVFQGQRSGIVLSGGNVDLRNLPF